MFAQTLEVAIDIEDAELALMLLRPFAVPMVAPAHATVLARLAGRYLSDWVAQLLAAWRAGPPWRMHDQERLDWIRSIPALCVALERSGAGGAAVARLLLRDSWTSLADAIALRRSVGAPSRRDKALEELAEPIAAMLTGAATVPAAEVRDVALMALREAGDDLLGCLVQVQRAMAGADATTLTETGARDLAVHCVERLKRRLARPQRRPGDWSIELPSGCTCDLCQTLAVFLADREQRHLDWPLAEQRRHHIHVRIDSHELPVRHQTRRTGRPYTLMLTKTESLFEREAEARRRDHDDLAWIRARIR